MTVSDLSSGLEEQAGYITFLAGAWQDFGYENPPSPECKTVPPLGERSAEAVKSGHQAIGEIDELVRRLYVLRGRLVGELREDSDLRAVRVDAMLARFAAERAAETVSLVSGDTVSLAEQA